MKTIAIVLMSVFAFSFAALAEDGDLPKLKDSMKIVGAEFKAIAAGLKSGSIDVEHLESLENLQGAASDASVVYPKKADNFEKKATYSIYMAALMREALILETEMESVLDKGGNQDLKSAKGLLTSMNNIRKKAHDEFK